MKSEKLGKKGNARPKWTMRLSAASMDFFVCVAIVTVTKVPPAYVPLAGMLVMGGYYFLMELRWHRTLGKMLMGLSYEEPEARGRLSVRLFLRLLLGPLGLLSWKRVTLLDWLSATRVKLYKVGGLSENGQDGGAGWR